MPRPHEPPKAGIDALTEADLDEFLALLKANFINPETLSELELKRATAAGVLRRIAPGAAILDEPPNAAAEPSPFRSEILDRRIGYVRLGSCTPGNLAELDAALQQFTGKPLAALVLDLRATPASSDFAQAAAVCGRFCPKGKVLFTLRKPNIKQEQIFTSKEDPRWRGVLVTLVDEDTAGVAEVIAAVVRSHVRAMVIGEQTRGEAVEFATFTLPSGVQLRMAVGEIALPEKVNVFPGGVKPDLAIDVAPETTRAVLDHGLAKGMSELVFETERPRMNEAALVAGQNPELDALQAAQLNRGEKAKAPLRDAVLQRAVDFITALTIYEQRAGGK